MPLLGKRANLPTACLPLLAALTPEGHHVTLLDENVQELNFDEIAKADIVGLTGMIVQRFRMKEILAELKRRNVFVVIGGPGCLLTKITLVTRPMPSSSVKPKRLGQDS